jgi:phosphatidylinositol glycan class V
LTGLGLARHAYTEAICAVAISHVAHLLGVWAMYGLTLALVAGPARHRVAFVAAALHVLSPGGLFLSAPYGESLASLLVLVGYVLYVGGSRGGSHGLSRDASLLAAGICFGLATSVRSNGLLNGLLFLEDALRTLVGVRKVTLSWVRRLFAIGLGGVCVGLGFAGPQYLAHRQLCRLDPATMQMSRPWCSSMFPSVYAFVQTHYW